MEADRFDSGRDEVVERVRQWAQERLGIEHATLFIPFVDQYYGRVGAADLTERSVPDLYGAALAHLRLALSRRRGEPKVAVYSPAYDEHGFASPHTIVDIVTDDMPFLVDSLTMELRRQGLGLHVIIHPLLTVRRNVDGELLSVLGGSSSSTSTDDTVVVESYHHIEIDRQTDPTVVDGIRNDLVRVLGDVIAAVTDAPAMIDRAAALARELDAETAAGTADRAEGAEFLRWLNAGNFTFLGYREYYAATSDGEDVLRAAPGTGRGILRDTAAQPQPHRL